MHPVLYTVTATLPDVTTLTEYVDWLSSVHVAEVVAAGKARYGRVVRVVDPPEPLRIESQYLFASRAAYESYLNTHANRMRAEGLLRFPTERGIRFERRLCEVVADIGDAVFG